MKFFKNKITELDSKARAISVMYLYKAKSQLEAELNSGKWPGEDEQFTTDHDIKCIERAIEYLEGKPCESIRRKKW